MKKSEITATIKEWIEDIDCDIKADWIDEEDRLMSVAQKMQLCTILGLLDGLGENRNIRD